MSAVSIYRILLLVRVGWLLVEWFFGWDARRHVSFTLLHPYASLFAHAAAEFALLVILTGLWFFRGWARLLFALAFALSVVDGAFWPYHVLALPPSFVLAITWCVVMLNGAIVAMCFRPPVRDVFVIQR